MMREPRWVLNVYPKGSDSPVRVYELSGVTVKELQKLFHQPASNPMYDCYPVTEAHAAPLEKLIGANIVLAAYDYFVECESNS